MTTQKQYAQSTAAEFSCQLLKKTVLLWMKVTRMESQVVTVVQAVLSMAGVKPPLADAQKRPHITLCSNDGTPPCGSFLTHTYTQSYNISIYIYGYIYIDSYFVISS